MREMVRGQPRFGGAAFQDDRVVAVVVHGELAADRVGKAHPAPRDARGTEADHVGLARREPLDHLIGIGVPPDGPLAVVARQGTRGPLPGSDLLQVLLGREARVSAALTEQFADVGQVGQRSRRLGVGPVAAGQVVLVRADGEVLERLGELLGRALGEPGLVGVLQADQVDAAGLVGHVSVDRRREHAADGEKARRARRDAGDLRPFGQVTRRVAVLPMIRSRQVRREQRISNLLAEHERAAPKTCGHGRKAAYPHLGSAEVPA